jgi:hypothetical protein
MIFVCFSHYIHVYVFWIYTCKPPFFIMNMNTWMYFAHFKQKGSKFYNPFHNNIVIFELELLKHILFLCSPFSVVGFLKKVLKPFYVTIFIQ